MREDQLSVSGKCSCMACMAIHMRHVWDTKRKTLQEGDPAVLVQVANGEVLYLG